jgi:GNAT superfamily N-acetyltransferase
MVTANKSEREWSIREYREGDEEQILELRELVFNDHKGKEWWKWMYRDGPLGPARIFVAEAKQKIIGHSATIFVPVKIKDQVTRSNHGVDVMVHPDFRHQGLFIALLTNLPETLRWGINYGIPNDQARPSFVKRLNAIGICEVPLLLKVVDWGIVLKTHYRIPVFIGKLLGYAWERMTGRVSLVKDTGIEIEEVFSFDERIDKFWEKASKLKTIMIAKNMKYLNWRYVAKPGKEYKIFIAKKQTEIVGYIVTKFEKGIRSLHSRGYIIDLLTLPDECTVAELLIASAVRYLKQEEATTISCWMLPDTSYYKTLRKLGFVRRAGPLLFVRVFDPNIPREVIANAANWYYVMGDDDAL